MDALVGVIVGAVALNPEPGSATDVVVGATVAAGKPTELVVGAGGAMTDSETDAMDGAVVATTVAFVETGVAGNATDAVVGARVATIPNVGTAGAIVGMAGSGITTEPDIGPLVDGTVPGVLCGGDVDGCGLGREILPDAGVGPGVDESVTETPNEPSSSTGASEELLGVAAMGIGVGRNEGAPRRDGSGDGVGRIDDGLLLSMTGGCCSGGAVAVWLELGAEK